MIKTLWTSDVEEGRQTSWYAVIFFTSSLMKDVFRSAPMMMRSCQKCQIDTTLRDIGERQTLAHSKCFRFTDCALSRAALTAAWLWKASDPLPECTRRARTHFTRF